MSVVVTRGSGKVSADCAAAREIKLSVRPGRARAGLLTRFRFRTTVIRGGKRRAVHGARIRFAGHRVRTNRRGRASLVLRLGHSGRRAARASKKGLVGGNGQGQGEALMGLSAYVGVGRSLETALQRVELAERSGYESVFITHIAGRDSLTVLMAYASRSERVRLGTGVMPIYSRTPVATAQSFATLDDFSGGRAVIGLGVSHRPVVEGWYDSEIGKPVSEMREYLGIVRAILRGEDPPKGERFNSGFHFAGFEPRADIPIYIAALSPACCAWRARWPTA